MKDAILQAVMQGKLTEQLESDKYVEVKTKVNELYDYDLPTN